VCLCAAVRGVRAARERSAPLHAGSDGGALDRPGSTPRNLFRSGGNNMPRPASDARYDVIERDHRRVQHHLPRPRRERAANGRQGGPEAQTVAVPIVWALGYHQPPSYFVELGLPSTGQRLDVRGAAFVRTSWV